MNSTQVNLKNDRLLRVARGLPVDRPPVWLMRQAGRFLSEYRAVRAEAGSFHNMIAHPEYAAEVTLQPVDILGVDAAIIFSDILVIPEALGLPYEMIPGKGPFFNQTIRTQSDLDTLHSVDASSNLEYTYTAIRQVVSKLERRVPLIGFAGAPWTIFCYMTQGEGSRTFSVAKAIMYRDPSLAHQLLERITAGTIAYLKGQIQAGVDLVQLFDSWAGILDTDTYRKFALPYLQQICEAITEVPVTVFAKGAFFALEEIGKLDCQVVGLDWQTSPEMAQKRVSDKAFQGNLDPALLYGDPASIKKATLDMLRSFPKGKHIANLGHGIYPDLPREHVMTFVETVKGFAYE